ncbi:DNA polymerase I [Sphingorhabdus contaminans]|uniref:DNA polymerase I n=1 Tax=Sphingorhabdus contaminans TaxID=1343899 RepID=A0A553WKA9_9SPHN|nr:DNA polymerase I [Sphingorhabdus contaminans]TSB05122.1 DNA polymerase I [Sphingorhabdus contaminans]
MSEQKHLYLVDGSAYIFRAYHRLPPLTNIHGEPVGAVYGYTTMLWKLADDLHQADGPTHMAVVLDKSSQSFRNEIYDLYKANRPEPPEDLRPQFPMIRDATRAFSLPLIEEENVEADDMIASYAKAACAAGWHVTIVSSDKDLMQLVEPCVDMFDTMKNERIRAEEVFEKFGVGPEKVGDVLALMGDSVDNVPGVPGVGPKTATKLIQEFGDLESVLAAAPDMKPSKMRDNLIEHAEKARLSKVLVTLKEDCPLPIPLEDMKLGAIPEEPLAAFLQHHGFNSLLKRIGQVANTAAANKAIAGNPKATNKGDGAANAPVAGQAALPPAMPPIDVNAYECVTTADRLDHWISRAMETGLVAFDTETDSLEAVTARLVGFSLAVAPGEACYVPLGHGGTDLLAENPEQIPFAEALARLKPLLVEPSVLKIGQNLKYDISVLAQHGLTISPYDDTMVMSFALDAGDHGHGMDELARLHLGHECISYKSVTGTGKSQIGFAAVPLSEATKYAAEDADVTLRLWHHLKLRLSPDKVTTVYELVDRPLVPVLSKMECTGIKVDRAVLARLSGEFAAQMESLEKEIHELAGQPFTIGSPQQLGNILFEKMGFKGGKKGKSGQYSTDVTVLEDLAGQGVEIARKVLDWRQLAKLKSTYTDSLQEQINSRTGRVHTSYSLVGAQTGRLSSTDPNLQNIPIRTEMGRQIRDAFVAEPGNVILSADYSQIELRLAAHFADVAPLRDAFEKGEDIHARTAQEMFGEVNRDTRGRAKTINFSILYGISRWGLAKRLESTPDEAQALIDAYFKRFPGISNYIQETLATVRECGYSTTLFGRKTWFPRIKSANQAERQGSERAAINAPIQGTSADIIKRAMVRMGPALEAAGLPHVKMLLQVHDELVFELPEGDVAAASKVIEAVMANAAEPLVKLTVPLGVEIGTGPSWGAAH